MDAYEQRHRNKLLKFCSPVPYELICIKCKSVMFKPTPVGIRLLKRRIVCCPCNPNPNKNVVNQQSKDMERQIQQLQCYSPQNPARIINLSSLGDDYFDQDLGVYQSQRAAVGIQDISYNSCIRITDHFIWKMCSFVEKLKLPEKNDLNSIIRIFRNTEGYLICFEVYLGEIISFGIRLVQSIDDNSLAWPFHRKFTVKLVNSNNPTKSKIVIADQIFDQPKDVGWSNPGFIEHQMMKRKSLITDGFVDGNGSVFINIEIERCVRQ